MEYVQDDQGQIMVRDQKGNTKFFHINIINNAMLMKRHGFTPVPKPIVSLPAEQPIEDNTAETSEAKRRGRPPVNK